MKNIVRSISFILAIGITAQSHADLGQALGDVVSFGENGRERDRLAQEANERIAAANRAGAIKNRNDKIASLQELIKNAESTKSESIKVIASGNQLYAIYIRIANQFKKQITSQYQVDDQLEEANTMATAVAEDINIVRLALDKSFDPSLQKDVLGILTKVAGQRHQSVEAFLSKAIAKANFSRQEMINMNQQIVSLRVKYRAFLSSAEAPLKQQDELLNRYNAELKTLNDQIQAEAVAAEAARVAQANAARAEAARRAREESRGMSGQEMRRMRMSM